MSIQSNIIRGKNVKDSFRIPSQINSGRYRTKVPGVSSSVGEKSIANLMGGLPEEIQAPEMYFPDDGGSPSTGFSGVKGPPKTAAERAGERAAGFGDVGQTAGTLSKLGMKVLTSEFNPLAIYQLPAEVLARAVNAKAAAKEMESFESTWGASTDDIGEADRMDATDVSLKGYGAGWVTNPAFGKAAKDITERERFAAKNPITHMALNGFKGLSDLFSIDENATFDPSKSSMDFDVAETLGRGSMALQGISLNSKGQPVQKQGIMQSGTDINTTDPTSADFSFMSSEDQSLNDSFGDLGSSGVSSLADQMSYDAEANSQAGSIGAGDGGASVLCTELHRQGILSDELYFADSLYASKLDPNIVHGYHIWAVPIAKRMKTSRVWTAAAKPFVLAWTQHAAFKEGFSDRDSMFGILIEAVGKPLCKLLYYLKKESVECEA